MTMSETRQELRRRGLEVGEECLWNKLQEVDAAEKPARKRRKRTRQTQKVISVACLHFSDAWQQFMRRYERGWALLV